MASTPAKKLIKWSLIILLPLAAVLGIARWIIGPLPFRPGARADAPAQMACWPWPKAAMETPHPGVTHWTDRTSADGTVLHLFEFDFAANPRLRLELYDQDEDDAKPGDDSTDYWPRGVGQATRHLNGIGRGPVIAAWNGAFFMSAGGWGAGGIGHHVSPVVLHGVPRYNVGNFRWTFGVQYRQGRPAFKTLHLPDKAALARQFTFAAAGVQCLVRDGAPLKMHPYPKPGEKPPPQPVPSTPAEAGYIPTVDHLHTSRTSLGWTRDGGKFYLLIVKEPDREGASIVAQNRGVPMLGGWMVSDLQRFWLAMKAWGAINLDGGDVTQLTALRKDGRYLLVPPRWADARQAMVCPPDFTNAPGGGSIMYFYIREQR